MPDLPRDVAALLAEARQLDEGPGKVELLQEAVRRADHVRDPEAGFEVRLQLMESALVCGSADVLLVAYTWCLAQAERDPDRFNLYEVLWRYRWAIAYMPTFPEVSRDRIDAALADMTVRYRRATVSLRPVHLLRWKVALRMRDGRMASEARRAWRRARRDWLSDDEHTERLTEIDHLLFRRRWPEAATAAAGYLGGSTGHDRHLLSLGSKLMVPLLRLGRPGEAMAAHHRTYRKTIRNLAWVTKAGKHIEFLALTHNFPRAVKLVERYLPYCVSSDPEDRVEFYPALLVLFRRLRATGKEALRMRLTPPCPGFRPDGRYDLAELDRVHQAEAADLAARFDARNGNDAFARELAGLDDLLRLARPVPLPRS